MKSTIECPYPTVCEYDAYRKTGKHLCEHVVCPYALCVARLMEWRDAYLREAEKERPDGSEVEADWRCDLNCACKDFRKR